MRLDARKRDAGASDHVVYYWPIAGTGIRHILGTACAFDSDEKWVEIFIWAPLPVDVDTNGDKKYRVMTADGKIQTAKLYIDYDVVNKRTGETVASVRQSWK